MKFEKNFEEKIKLLLDSKSLIENRIRIVEELGELSKEILKDIRGQINTSNLLEELADVVIELHMLKEIYNISDETLEKVINKKMDKNMKRLELKL